MKKTYQTPRIEVIKVQETIMVNASFGSGITDTMHAKEATYFDLGGDLNQNDY